VAQLQQSRSLPLPVAERRWHWRWPRIPISWRILLQRRELDRRLASGEDPSSSALLALRGAQLTSEASRGRLARSLDALIAPRSGPVGLSSVLRPRADLRDSRIVLRALQGRLVGEERLEPGGIALLKWLVGDSASVLYTEPDPVAVSSVLRLAAANMTYRRQPDD
jgi:hypothetical protein